MTRLIINADDLGLNIVVNQRIEECIQLKVITSTSIMSGGIAFDDAVVRIKKYPQISVGVHLHLDECESITKSPILKRYGLIDDNGYFKKGVIQEVKITKELGLAIREEWDAQIVKVKESGLLISHIDSHRHCHNRNELIPVLKYLTKKHGIKRVRLDNAWYPILLPLKQVPNRVSVSNKSNDEEIKYRAYLLYKKIYRYCKKYIFRLKLRMNFQTADYFTSVECYVINQNRFNNYWGGKTIELMCHPGHPKYEEETLLLPFVKGKNVKLISYWDL